MKHLSVCGLRLEYRDHPAAAPGSRPTSSCSMRGWAASPCGGTSRTTGGGHRLPHHRLVPGRLRSLPTLAPGPHPRYMHRARPWRPCPVPRRPGNRASAPGRPQRRRQHRPDLRRSLSRAPLGWRSWPPTNLSRPRPSPASAPPGRPGKTPIGDASSGATTTSPSRYFTTGTIPGCRPNSATGTSRHTSRHPLPGAGHSGRGRRIRHHAPDRRHCGGGAGTELLKLARCGHSPHRDQPAAVLSALAAWVGRVSGSCR